MARTSMPARQLVKSISGQGLPPRQGHRKIPFPAKPLCPFRPIGKFHLRPSRFAPAGASEISRWCQPPEPPSVSHAPRQGCRKVLVYVEWWHRRGEARTQTKTLLPVATHDLIALSIPSRRGRNNGLVHRAKATIHIPFVDRRNLASSIVEHVQIPITVPVVNSHLIRLLPIL